VPGAAAKSMRVCFIHQNLPAQYRHLIAALLQRGDQVLAIGEQSAVQRWNARHPRLGVLGYRLSDQLAQAAVPTHLRTIHLQTARAEAVLQAVRQLLDRKLLPDLVVAHPGWGEAMYLRGALPHTPLLAYCEFFYRPSGSDVDFDPEYAVDDRHWQRLQLRNMPQLLALHDMDAGWCATQWQRQQFPQQYRDRLWVQHEGVDTAVARPDPQARLTIAGQTLRAGDPIVTYVARNLEPYRGFHIFMRSLPLLQQRVPQAWVVVVGGDEVSYGVHLPPGENYRSRLMAELGDRVDWSRVLFTGRLPHADFIKVLQVSAVHAYLSYPFVLSWSLLEAMAAGCCIVGSATPPVLEVIEDGVNGRLVDFFDHEGLARALAQALQHPADTRALREAARRTVRERYDLHEQCLSRGLAMLDRLAATPRPTAA
jgi:glycosyltransferase involved in cell wall biosynthesis